MIPWKIIFLTTFIFAAVGGTASIFLEKPTFESRATLLSTLPSECTIRFPAQPGSAPGPIPVTGTMVSGESLIAQIQAGLILLQSSTFAAKVLDAPSIQKPPIVARIIGPSIEIVASASSTELSSQLIDRSLQQFEASFGQQPFPFKVLNRENQQRGPYHALHFFASGLAGLLLSLIFFLLSKRIKKDFCE